MSATVSRSVTPGEWYGILGDDVVVLLPPAARSRVSGVWERVDDGAGFDEVLDAVISGGLRELPGFLLVSTDGEGVKVVIRGAGEAELTTADGPVTVSGTEDSTWVERLVTGVSTVRLRVGEGTGAPYTVGAGLVRVAVVEQSSADQAAVVGEPSAEQAEVVEEPATAPAVDEEPAGVPTDSPPVFPAAAAGPPPSHRRAEDPALTEQIPATPAEPDEPPAPDDGPRSPAAYVPPVPVAVPTSAPAVTPPGPGAGSTPAGAGGTPQSPPLAARPVARLIFSSGDVVDVDRPVLIGRSPDAGRLAVDGRGRLLTVPSPNQEISSTHVEIRPGAGSDEGAAVVTDLGSTNGTTLIRPGLPAEDLQPGVAVPLVPGAMVDLGDGVTIQVTTV